MDFETTVLFVIVGLLGANQAVSRLPALRDRSPVFWGMQFVNLGVGTSVLVFGLPGFEHFPPIRYVVGLMFFLHIATNMQARTHAEQRRLDDARAERRRRTTGQDEAK